MLLTRAKHTLQYQQEHKHMHDTPIDNALGFIILIGLYILFLWAEVMAIKEFRRLKKEGSFKGNKELLKSKLIPLIIVGVALVFMTVLIVFLLSRLFK